MKNAKFDEAYHNMLKVGSDSSKYSPKEQADANKAFMKMYYRRRAWLLFLKFGTILLMLSIFGMLGWLLRGIIVSVVSN
jgi:hypothetical protein